MKEKLKQVIEEKYGKLEGMEELDRSKAFLEIHRDLAEIMERDFSYSLQIMEKKNAIQ